jgi:plasmid stability protein
MGQVLIRNLDDELIADYKQAAAGGGRSLEAELRDALSRARPKQKPSSSDLVALAHRLWAMTPPSAAAVDSTPLIREDRNAR